ncbi:MAG: class I SAM-dependent methyltransferase [Clostridia bacterium]|nr:class I SAM-dependent methyltransferase [Clostridia bacterium]
MDDNVRYYDEQAARFVRETLAVDLSASYAPFVRGLPAGGRVLDAGCGSGRDTAAFLRMGYRVTAFDASAGMVEAAARMVAALGEEEQSRARVIRATFVGFPPPDAPFNGIWACASLLHVRRAELSGVVGRLAGMLAPGGVFYASFKYGTQEGERNGRYFNDYDENTFRRFLDALPSLKPLELAVTHDARPGRENELWLNAYLRKETL